MAVGCALIGTATWLDLTVHRSRPASPQKAFQILAAGNLAKVPGNNS
jgi:hypothetical protein